MPKNLTVCERTVTSKQTTDKEDIQIYNYIYIFLNWFITTFDECVHNSTRSLIAFTIKLLISAIFNLYFSTTTKKWIKKRNRSPKRAQITKYYIGVLCSKKKETVEFKILKYFFLLNEKPQKFEGKFFFMEWKLNNPCLPALQTSLLGTPSFSE